MDSISNILQHDDSNLLDMGVVLDQQCDHQHFTIVTKWLEEADDAIIMNQTVVLNQQCQCHQHTIATKGLEVADESTVEEVNSISIHQRACNFVQMLKNNLDAQSFQQFLTCISNYKDNIINELELVEKIVCFFTDFNQNEFLEEFMEIVNTL